MSSSNAWQFKMKKHMEMPCSCAFSLSAVVHVHYFTRDQTHPTACMLAPPSFSFGFIYLIVVFSPPCSAGAGEKS